MLDALIIGAGPVGLACASKFSAGACAWPSWKRAAW